jgi:polysaccharide deacetylase 2 family uncharacterized protein YibQ
MSKSQKAAKPKTQKKSNKFGGAGTIFLALLLLLSVGGAYYYFQQSAPVKSGVSAKEESRKNDADYNARCETLHGIVDQLLSSQNMVVGDVQRIDRDAPRENNKGLIRWNSRNLLIDDAAGVSADALKARLDPLLKAAGGSIIKTEPDQYHGYTVTRLDIGFIDQLGGGPLTIVSDRLYLVSAGSKPVVSGPRKKANTANRAEIAIVIDDFGFRQDMIAEFAAIRRPFTFAVLPFKQYSKEAAAKGLASGHQVMLHLPMEPLSGIDPSEISSTVKMDMDTAQVRELIDRATASLPGIIGINNHQGSRATADRKTMENVMKVLREKQLFFVDSRTHAKSVAADVARQQKIKTTENDLFLDGIADAAYVKKQLRTAGEMALRHGSITVIGHARPTTAAAMREVMPELEAKGIRFVFVSQLVH